MYTQVLVQSLTTLALSRAAASIGTRQAATLPTEDPFYTPVAGYGNAAVGSILAYRPPPTPLSFLGVSPLNVAAAWQTQFRTTDNDGTPTVAINTIIIPHNANFSRLLAYEAAIDSSSLNCEPSYAFQTLPAADTVISQGEIVAIEAALGRGWVVVVPDFEGLKAAWLARRLTAYITLDSIRATLSSTSFTHILPNATITMWGYSGGGIASGVTAELQPSYAPEIKIVGAVVGGPSPNIGNVLVNINEGAFSGITIGGLWGLANAYSQFNQIMQDSLVPATASEFLYTRSNNCILQNLVNF